MDPNAGKTVAEILKGKLGRIKNARLDPGSPSWDDILHLSWEEVKRRKRRGDVGFKTFYKLLLHGRYNK